MFDAVIDFIRSHFRTTDFIPLHEPRFWGRELEYVKQCIDSTFVSSVGEFVNRFEEDIAAYTGARYAVATVNGTCGLHVALQVAGVKPGDEVITQSLSFVATANAISYAGATPCFVDVDRDTLGLSPDALTQFLDSETKRDSHTGSLINIATNRTISACVPMHTFGHPCRIDQIVEICDRYGIPVVEDAAESLGSRFHSVHTGRYGVLGVFSLNGNKTITSGGGGAIITDDEGLAQRAKHLTTTAKVPHRWEFNHDEIGYNYRMPNINAALACAQLEQLHHFLECKRNLADAYRSFFDNTDMTFITEPNHAHSNYWLNALVMDDQAKRDRFLEATNDAGVMTRPVWGLLSELKMYRKCHAGSLENAKWLADRVVNVPSSSVDLR